MYRPLSWMINWTACMDGRLEGLCTHGVGHTIYVPAEYVQQEAWWIHGCDGMLFQRKRR